jgi:hypothetical protein
VAILAAIGGIDVRGIFACGIDPIVARSTVATDRRVIELGITPCVGVVAIHTVVRGFWMRRGLALGGSAIVARLTTADYSTVVDASYVIPVFACMTAFTIVGNFDVSQGNDARGALCIASVALHAGAWRSLKNASIVATIALNTLVRAI